MNIATAYRKLRENDAFDLVLHPRVMANLLRSQRENRERPLVMRSMPSRIEIELTNRCNLACTQCLRSQGLRPYAMGDMSFEHFTRVLAQFPESISIGLNGFGEPLLHPRFSDMVRHARRTHPWAKISIYSNGMLLDDARCRALVDGGVTEVDVSIDAARPDTYRRIRRGGELAAVHEGIARLLRARRAARARLPMVGTNFVLLNDNEGELVEFVEQAAALGVDFVNCITYAAYDWGFENGRTPESYQRELGAARRRLDALGVRCKSFPSDDLGWTDPAKRFDCGFFWQQCRVTFEGHVTLGCCVPFKETYSYGNLLETPFSEIWNGEAFRRNRERALRGEAPVRTCASCDRFGREFFARVSARLGG